MVTIKIQCPSCFKKGSIEVEENLVKNSKRGITALNVAEDLVCEHSFVAYIDKNMKVRDSFIADFTIELPQIKMEEPSEELKIPDQEMINIYLLLLNYSASWLAKIMRCCFYKTKFVMINDVQILNSHIINLFEFIFQNTFDINLVIINHKDYRENKKLYKDYIIIDKEKVENDKNKILKSRSLKIESKIIQDFLNETNLKTSLIIIKNEILKVYMLAKDTLEFINNLGEGTPLDARELNSHLNKIHNVKIQNSYLDFLVDIVRYYHGVKIIDAADFMAGL
ncbi:MAG: hypothetical protein ACFFBP_10930 [Promethearchaeota archaeon]